MKRLKLGLVLGGGGARGLAHIGILKALERAGLAPDIISGTSMGAMVAAAYAQNPRAEIIEKRFRNFIFSEKFKSMGGNRFRQENIYEPENLISQISREVKRRIIINLAAHRKSMLKSTRIDFAVEELIDPGKVEDTVIPFSCAAIDLVSGRDKIFTSGNIQRAVKASSAIPGFLPPVEYDDYQLVDGSVSINFPVQPVLDQGADVLIISNVSTPFEVGIKQDNVVDIIMRSHSVATRRINESALAQADFVLNPPIGSVHWSEFEKIDLLIERGENEGNKAVESLHRLVARRSRFSYRLKKRILVWIKERLN
ncbi:MAG TPA: hypothetical protein ENK44_00085 [Caldithrix abyssi]|uniref:PNPLA domain-containing protein n=1 Tax=Caldithrix abyssi TaxID=187145 RepID=A0A7V4TXA8_CALAY|nr:hypothetical protein [Caldithrix abyssi]